MPLFLNGGGCAEQVKDSYCFFKETIDTKKPLLYIPLAMKNDRYPSCLSWITQELADFHFPKIEMITDAKELNARNLDDYAAIFIGGGCTYKLLAELKACGADQQIRDFLNHGGVVFGGSAGAIIFGKDLDSCRHDDANDVNLKDIAGFDMVFGAYVGAHYPNEKPERTQKAMENYTQLSLKAPVIALPEEDTLVIEKDEVRVIGSRAFCIFKDGKIYPQKANTSYSVKAFKEKMDQLALQRNSFETKSRC